MAEELFRRWPVSEEKRRRMDAAYPVFAGDGGQAPFGPSGYMLPVDAEPFLRQYVQTPVDPGDVWIVTLPKCGTTWTQEMVWLIQNDCDYKGAQCLLCPDRYQFLEIACISAPHQREEVRQGNNPISKRNMFSRVEERPKPWFVKTHLPLHYCPPALLERGKVQPYSEVNQLPYFPHVLEAWKQRHNPNLLFLFFEDMKRDLRGTIQKVADFLGKSLTKEQLDGLEFNLHFDSMKKNPWVNKSMAYAYSPLTAEELEAMAAKEPPPQFMRKGQTGDWKNHMSQQTSDKMDAWIQRELAGSDLKFITG
ncbi:Sulfotransferase 1C4 [Amphibalanus amphitrite]|uniref:Sulfotransferase 1C4 n=1 Tax=Amphibalanus amphitrite TaxID=1232801 RepID=A0A6A4WP09_AMPAM|nr:Sulfotransferase 1C4 [Amphibalanus amphitrite]